MNAAAFDDIEGPVLLACAAPYGEGGMGRHLLELHEALIARGLGVRCYATRNAGHNYPQPPAWLRWISRLPPIRFSPAWQGYLQTSIADRWLANATAPFKTVIAFNGQCLRTFQQTFAQKILVAATPHVNLTVRQAREAWEYAAIEPLGYIAREHKAYLREYELADRILYATEYIRESFLAEKIPAEKLRRFDLTAHPRFKPAPNRKSDEKFRIVSVGSLNLVKGVAVLLDAFKLLEAKNAELTLVGGSGTPQMRRFLERRVSENARIRIAPGDPLPHLQAADVCAHAAFQDGFAYAPMEALACGVPVVVTDHTGMKENVREGENGYIVPTGDPQALANALKRVRSGGLNRA